MRYPLLRGFLTALCLTLALGWMSGGAVAQDAPAPTALPGFPSLLHYKYDKQCIEDVHYRMMSLKYDPPAIELEGVLKAACNHDGNLFNYNFGPDPHGNIRGAAAPQAMKHRAMKPYSPTKELSAWHYLNIQNPLFAKSRKPEERRPYIGPIYQGARDAERYMYRLVQTGSRDVLESCQQIISPNANEKPGGKKEEEIKDGVNAARLELDSCANQYILYRAGGRRAIEDQGENPDDSPTVQAGFSTMTEALPEYKFCQPLVMLPVDKSEQEYEPGSYYEGARKKLLEDPKYQMRTSDMFFGINLGKIKAPEGTPFFSVSHEPDYSMLGVTIDKKRLKKVMPAQPVIGPKTINDLAEFPFERIYDPSHPFTPRWDFWTNERERYSPFTAQYNSAGATMPDAVRCAGSRGPINSPASIPVDLLTWRENAFRWYVAYRILVNIACYNIQVYGQRVCWDWNGCTADEPCCSTRWDQKNDKLPFICGTPMPQVCDHISKPLVPANALKMRMGPVRTELGKISVPLLDRFPNGVPEGYSFYDYFGNHRPYMRCWDTGLECGLPPGSVNKKQKTTADWALRTSIGANYAIVGAGREASVIGGGKDGEYCGIGGDGDGVTGAWNLLGPVGYIFKGPTPNDRTDSITDWMELKLYQARGTRYRGYRCIPRHEKAFKEGTGEEFVLGGAGGEYQRLVASDKEGTGKKQRYRTFPWPLHWRGYVDAPNADDRFPNFGDAANPSLAKGLDDAKPGDILVFDEEVVGGVGAQGRRMPYVAFVTDTDNVWARKGKNAPKSQLEWVKAATFNRGKFPDACGNTDMWRRGTVFTMYKKELPAYNKALLKQVGAHTETCDDPLMSSCKETLWDKVKVYDPRADLHPPQ